MQNQKPQLTNADNSRKLQLKADKLTLARVRRYWTIFEDASKTMESQTIRGVNALREVGEGFKALGRHEQITAEFFEGVKRELPKSLDYRKARCAVHISNQIDAPVKTAAEAFAVQRELFAVMTDAKEPHRQIAQTSHESNPVSELVNWSCSFSRIFAASESSEPVSSWSAEKKMSVLAAFEPIVQKYNEIKGLLEPTHRHD